MTQADPHGSASSQSHAKSVARLARAKILFLDAIELGIADRDAFLENACKGDKALRTLVDELLAGEALPLPVESLADDIRAAAIDPQLGKAADGRGSMIGRYRLLERIGEGGFGVVFAAEQTVPVKRMVALKLIKLGMDTRQVVARFEAERQALAMMEHPGIAKVFDAGATETGRPYFVMELVKGLPITQYCDSKSLSVRECLELFMQVCDAVQHAHNRGIIHRDLKPSNVLVTESGTKSLPKVIDFGIAKATSGTLTDKTVYTQMRQMIGTPEYMSPEQASVSSVDIDTRTDVYSLGVILYELLTGMTPFDGSRLRSAAYGEVQRIISEEEPPRPSTRLTQQIRKATIDAKLHGAPPSQQAANLKLPSSIQGDLDWIAMKAMEKDRDRRYDSASALSMDTARYLAGKAVLAAPPSKLYQTRKFVRRNWLVVSAASTVAAAILLGTVGVAWQARVARMQRDEALLAQRRAENTTEFVTNVLRSSDPHTPDGGESMTVLQAMQNAISEMNAGRFSEDPQTDASLRTTIGTVMESFARTEEAAVLYEQALNTLRKEHASDHPHVAISLRRLSYMRLVQFRTEESRELAEQALAMSRRLSTGDSKELTESLSMAAILRTSSDPQGAIELHREVLAMDRRMHPNGSEAAVYALFNIGRTEIWLGRDDAAERTLRDALAESQKLGAESPLLRPLALAYVGDVLRERGDFVQAEQYTSEGLALYTRRVPQPTWNSASQNRDLASIKVDLGKAAEAEALCFEAARYDLTRHPPLHASLLNTRGRARQLLGRTSEARADFDESIAIMREANHADGSRVLAELLLHSAQAHLDNHEPARALQELREANDLANQSLLLVTRVRNAIRDTLLIATEAAAKQ